MSDFHALAFCHRKIYLALNIIISMSAIDTPTDRSIVSNFAQNHASNQIFSRENYKMTLIQSLKAFFGSPTPERSGLDKGRDFDRDYAVASNIVKKRLNEKFPDGYYASLKSDFGSARDYSSDRKDAVDTISQEISLALRSGASVEEAAMRAAEKVGL